MIILYLRYKMKNFKNLAFQDPRFSELVEEMAQTNMALEENKIMVKEALDAEEQASLNLEALLLRETKRSIKSEMKLLA
jgi:hypothetical protein